MKNFIYTILSVERDADVRIERLTRRLWKTASFTYGNTWDQIDAMLDIIEEKQQIQDAVELIKLLKKGLTEQEYTVLASRRDGLGYREIAHTLGMSVKSAYRKTLDALKAAENLLFLFGYDDERLKKSFGQISMTFEHDRIAAWTAA